MTEEQLKRREYFAIFAGVVNGLLFGFMLGLPDGDGALWDFFRGLGWSFQDPFPGVLGWGFAGVVNGVFIHERWNERMERWESEDDVQLRARTGLAGLMEANPREPAEGR